jgi:hypothetical protein
MVLKKVPPVYMEIVFFNLFLASFMEEIKRGTKTYIQKIKHEKFMMTNLKSIPLMVPNPNGKKME